MKFIKDNLYIIVGVILVFCLLSIFVNACYEGTKVLITQHKINETYKVHK